MNRILTAALYANAIVASVAACSMTSPTVATSASPAQSQASQQAAPSDSPGPQFPISCRLAQIPPNDGGPALVPEITVKNNSGSDVNLQDITGGLVVFDVKYYEAGGKLAAENNADSQLMPDVEGNTNGNYVAAGASVTYWPGLPEPGGSFTDDMSGMGYKTCSATMVPTDTVQSQGGT